LLPDKCSSRVSGKALHEMSIIDPDIVPATLDEALEIILSRMPEQDRLYLEGCEKDPSPRFHFQLGMSLRNDWSLWEKGMPLVKWFNERGITHADDMSAIILTSIWSRARGVDLDLEGQIKSYQDYWIRNIGKPAP
jgi:hypothetical protein